MLTLPVELKVLYMGVVQVNMDWPTTRALFDAVALEYEYDGITVSDRVYSDDSMELCLSIERSLFDVAQNKVSNHCMDEGPYVSFTMRYRRLLTSLEHFHNARRFS